MDKMQAKWTIEPGDGTGYSIQDFIARNQNGVCSLPRCGKLLHENAVSYGLVQKLCVDCEIWLKNDEILLEAALEVSDG